MGQTCNDENTPVSGPARPCINAESAFDHSSARGPEGQMKGEGSLEMTTRQEKEKIPEDKRTRGQ